MNPTTLNASSTQAKHHIMKIANRTLLVVLGSCMLSISATSGGAASPGSSAAIVNTCGEDGAVLGDHDDDAGTPETWELTCTGTCSAGATHCKEREATDATGDFRFCGCGTGQTHWPSKCCGMVLRPDESGAFVPTRWGTCPDCPSTGICAIIADPNNAAGKQVGCFQ